MIKQTEPDMVILSQYEKRLILPPGWKKCGSLKKEPSQQLSMLQVFEIDSEKVEPHEVDLQLNPTPYVWALRLPSPGQASEDVTSSVDSCEAVVRHNSIENDAEVSEVTEALQVQMELLSRIVERLSSVSSCMQLVEPHLNPQQAEALEAAPARAVQDTTTVCLTTMMQRMELLCASIEGLEAHLQRSLERTQEAIECNPVAQQLLEDGAGLCTRIEKVEEEFYDIADRLIEQVSVARTAEQNHLQDVLERMTQLCNRWEAGQLIAAKAETPSDEPVELPKIADSEDLVLDMMEVIWMQFDAAEQMERSIRNKIQEWMSRDPEAHPEGWRVQGLLKKMLPPPESLTQEILQVVLAYREGLRVQEEKLRQRAKPLGIEVCAPQTGVRFDPRQARAVVMDQEVVIEKQVQRLVRPGFVRDGKVLRYADVAVRSVVVYKSGPKS